MNRGQLVLAGVLAMVLASSAWGQAVPLTDFTLSGGIYEVRAGTPYGHLWLAGEPAGPSVRGAGYGFSFAGPTKVSGITIAQSVGDSYDVNRKMVERFSLYADGVHVGYALLEPTKNAQPAQLVDLDNKPIASITATWFVLKSSVGQLYPDKSADAVTGTEYGTDRNIGLASVAFFGAPNATPEVNLNAGMTVTSSGVSDRTVTPLCGS